MKYSIRGWYSKSQFISLQGMNPRHGAVSHEQRFLFLLIKEVWYKDVELFEFFVVLIKALDDIYTRSHDHIFLISIAHCLHRPQKIAAEIWKINGWQ